MLKVMVTPGERIAEEEDGSEDTDDTDTTSSVGDTCESFNMLFDMLPSSHIRSRSLPPSPTHTRFNSLPPSHARTRSHGKAKKTKDREHPYIVISRRYKRTRKEIAFISRRVLCR